jgi:hypothetical protein
MPGWEAELDGAAGGEAREAGRCLEEQQDVAI